MSHKGNDDYNERLAMIEQDLSDAREEREKAIEEITKAVKWYDRMNAKVALEEINLMQLKNKNL